MKICEQSAPPSELLSDSVSGPTPSSEPVESSPYAGLSLSHSIYNSLRETFSGFVNWIGVMPLAQAAPQPILEHNALSASDLADFMELISELGPPEVQKKIV